jgi:hypothetical protein
MKEHYHRIFLERNYLILGVILTGLMFALLAASLSEAILPQGDVRKVALWLFAAVGFSGWVAVSFWLVISIILLWRRDVQYARSLDSEEKALSTRASRVGELPPVERFEKADLPIELLHLLMMEEKSNGR